MKEELYIEIPRWDEFQHYKSRDPIWIKAYTRLLSDDKYLSLSAAQRALLHGLWILYAKSNRKVLANTSKLSRKLELRVTKRSLESLRDAGFIEILASSLLAQRREEESRKLLASTTTVENPARKFQLAVLKSGNEEVA